MKKFITAITLSLIVLLSGCADINNTTTEPNDETKKPITYTVNGETNFSGTIKSIEGSVIELEDGTKVSITEDIFVQSSYVTMIVEEGPSEYEFYIKEITYQGSLLINPGTDTLEVNLENNEAEVSGNITYTNGTIIQIMDKRFILTENTVFSTVIDSEDPLVTLMLGEFEVGNIIMGYGYKSDSNTIISGTISKATIH